MADNIWTAAVEGIAARGRANNGAEGDYRDEEGFLCCGKCHTRKEGDITIGEKTLRVPHLCKCESEASRQREAEEKAAEFRKQCERLRKDGITDPSYLSQNFTQDDNRNARISDVCRRYVEHWPEMKADNIGILFYGGVGTGKSFLACCIANALIDKQVRASVTNFPRILNKLQGFGEDKQEFLDKLSRYDLLVIDDLGVERDTSYSVEQVFNVIDARSRTGKPLIVTTNLSLADLQNPSSLGYTWIEPNRRRDKDNIAFAKKFIQDSLVHAGVLQNDGWKHIEHFTDDFAVDPKNPRVEVVIEEFEGGNKK